jgi:hypothetical protein
VRVDEWWLKFFFLFFFIFIFLQSCFFSLNQQYKMNEWLLSVVKKITYMRFPRIPLHLLKHKIMFFMNKNKKKNLILFHPFFLLYITIVWNCLSNVYVPFFLLLSLSRARWTRTTVCEFEALYNHVLKSENICIYIYGILPEFSVLIKSSWECLFSHPLFHLGIIIII